jgi:thymidine kinase
VVTEPTAPTRQDAPSALASVPAAGARRGMPMPARLTFFYGPMDCGKSTLALQIDHNHARQGRRGLLLTRYDRSGAGRISSRIGVRRDALEVADGTDLRTLVRSRWALGQRVDYLIVDEAQFLTAEHVEQLADLVDCSHVDVYAFGLATDFRGRLFAGSQRLFELADAVVPIQVEVLCWCGKPGLLNARVVDGAVTREGDTVVVADTGSVEDVRYQVLCRQHHRAGDLGPHQPPPNQLTLD